MSIAWGNERYLKEALHEVREREKSLIETLREAREREQRLIETLRDARANMKDWAGYADAYTRNRHNLAGDLAEIDAALAQRSEPT